MRSRFLVELAVIAAALWGARCGTREAAGSGSGVIAPDAGYSGADAGTSGVPGDGGGGSMDAGSGSNSGSADGGGDGGSPTGGTGTEGSGGPSASNDCTGLTASSDPGAATVSHFIWLRDSTGVDSCSPAVASGTGTVALTMQAYHSQTIDFVSSSGTLLASSPGAEGSTLIAGESGFIGNMTASMASWLEGWNASGAQSPTTTHEKVANVAEDPLGGVVALTGGTAPQITSFDTSLAVRWRVSRPADYPVALGVDRERATLFLFDGTRLFGANTLAGMWVDHAGVAGNVFQMLGPQRDLAFRLPFALTQRTGSGLFLALGPAWVAQLDSLATASSAAPDWLQARPNVRLHMVRGGKGYAVLPVEAQDAQDCVQNLEVVSPSGKSCGTTSFRAASGSCRTGPITVGYDGTVMQLAPDPDPAHQEWFGQGTCYWHWWPGLFR